MRLDDSEEEQGYDINQFYPSEEIINANSQCMPVHSNEEDFTLLKDYKSFYIGDSNICEACQSEFILCPLCNGYFDYDTFFNSHERKCDTLLTAYKNKENLIECKDCRSYVPLKEFNNHKDNCVNKIRTETMQCIYCREPFSITLIEEHEKTCENIQTELLLARETMDCSFCKEKVPMCHLEAHELTCKKLKEKQEELKSQIRALKIETPAEWEDEIYDTEVIDDNLAVITLIQFQSQFSMVVSLMQKSVPNVKVTNVYRIQNKYLWDRFAREQAKIAEEKGDAKEHWLFHGSRANKPAALYTIGFDISFASDSGSFGRGIYFAKNAAYSYGGYCYTENNKGYLFVAKVITGQAYNGSKGFGNDQNVDSYNMGGLKKPPLWDKAKFIYYDSVTDADDPNGNMFVVYENDKAYPYYLIEYDLSGNNNVIRPPILPKPVPRPYVIPKPKPNPRKKKGKK